MPKTSKDYFPNQIKLGHFVLTIKLLDSELIYNLGEQQGSYESRENKIYLDKDIVAGEPKQAVNLVIHELMHAIYYQYNLNKESTEEDIVNAMSNGITELLTRTDLFKWIEHKLKEV